MSGFAGTRAEREWLATLRRIADAAERVADAVEQKPAETAEGRQYAWIEGLRGSSIPDRSYVLRRIVDVSRCTVTPSFIAKAAGPDGEVVADLVYWYGVADAFQRDVAEEEFGLTVLSVGGGDWPPLPEGYERTLLSRQADSPRAPYLTRGAAPPSQSLPWEQGRRRETPTTAFITYPTWKAAERRP